MSIRFLIQEHKKQKMKSESKTEDVAAKLHIASLEEKIEMSDKYKGDYLKAAADVAFLNARIYQLEQELAEAKKESLASKQDSLAALNDQARYQYVRNMLLEDFSGIKGDYTAFDKAIDAAIKESSK